MIDNTQPSEAETEVLPQQMGQIVFPSLKVRIKGCTATGVFTNDKNKRDNGHFMCIMANFEPENIY